MTEDTKRALEVIAQMAKEMNIKVTKVMARVKDYWFTKEQMKKFKEAVNGKQNEN